MKSNRLLGHIAIVFLALPCLETPAQAAPPFTIDVLATFDYPGTGNLTRPQKINDAGNIAGSFVDSSGVNSGFVRFRNGDFSAPIIEPNQDFLTDLRGINNSGLLARLLYRRQFRSRLFPVRRDLHGIRYPRSAQYLYQCRKQRGRLWRHHGYSRRQSSLF